MAAGEMVIYYSPQKTKEAVKLKGVLIQMGVRIRNVTQEQAYEKVGFLAGLDGFEEGQNTQGDGAQEMKQELLIMKNFTGQRMDELFLRMRKAGVGRIHYKAVLTEHNVNWTLLDLYREIKKEHEAMQAGQAGESNGQKS